MIKVNDTVRHLCYEFSPFVTWYKDLSNLPVEDNLEINFVGEWRFQINWNVISQLKQKWGPDLQSQAMHH